MTLSAELLTKILSGEEAYIVFPQFEHEIKTVMESECFTMPEQIRLILMDDTLNDEDCFLKIDEIISVFTAHNIHVGFRHDI